MEKIFVFGSNLAGIHGAGSALRAYRDFDAKLGVGNGRTGSAYAIPTKDHMLGVLSIERIKPYVDEFIEYAKSRPDLDFELVAIGCGLAGFKPAEIAPLFQNAPANVRKPKEFL